MNAAQLMDKVFDIYKKSFWNQVAFAAIVSIVAFMAIFAATFVLVIVISVFVYFMTSGGMVADELPVLMMIGIVVALLPFVAVWLAFSSSGHILLSRQAFYGYPASIAHMGLFKVVFRVFTAVLAQLIIAFPFFAVAFGLLAMIAFFPGATAVFVIGLVLVAVGYVLLANTFSLSVAVAAFERRYFFGAIFRSWELVKPDYWRIFGVRIVWMLAVFAFSFSAQGIFMVITAAWGLVAGTMPMFYLLTVVVVMITSFVGPMVVSLLISPLDGIMQSLIYFNQRIKHEGFDLELRIEKL